MEITTRIIVLTKIVEHYGPNLGTRISSFTGSLLETDWIDLNNFVNRRIR